MRFVFKFEFFFFFSNFKSVLYKWTERKKIVNDGFVAEIFFSLVFLFILFVCNGKTKRKFNELKKKKIQKKRVIVKNTIQTKLFDFFYNLFWNNVMVPYSGKDGWWLQLIHFFSICVCVCVMMIMTIGLNK